MRSKEALLRSSTLYLHVYSTRVSCCITVVSPVGPCVVRELERASWCVGRSIAAIAEEQQAMSSQLSSASSSSSAASMPSPGLHTSNSSFFKSYITKVDANSRQKCSLCTKDWSSTTNIVNMEPHFQSAHHQIWKQRPRR